MTPRFFFKKKPHRIQPLFFEYDQRIGFFLEYDAKMTHRIEVDSDVLEERTNEVSLVGGGGLQSVNERAGCLPFWDSSLCASLVCAD